MNVKNVLYIFIFFPILFVNCSYGYFKIVEIPIHVNLKKDKYSILHIDTIYTNSINYKKIIYIEKK